MAWYLCILRPAARLREGAAWTADDQSAVRNHFDRLVVLAKDGVVRMAGKTAEPEATTLGIVVYKAEDIAEARKLAADDPAVKAGVMEMDIRPFSIAVEGGDP